MYAKKISTLTFSVVSYHDTLYLDPAQHTRFQNAHSHTATFPNSGASRITQKAQKAVPLMLYLHCIRFFAKIYSTIPTSTSFLSFEIFSPLSSKTETFLKETREEVPFLFAMAVASVRLKHGKFA